MTWYSRRYRGLFVQNGKTGSRSIESILCAIAPIVRDELPFDYALTILADARWEQRVRESATLDVSRAAINRLNATGFRLTLTGKDGCGRRVIGRDMRDFRHMPARFVKALFPAEEWEAAFKFGFVRNPWDWVLSNYLFNRFRFDPLAAVRIDRFGAAEFFHHLDIMKRYARGLPESVRTQLAFLGDGAGRILVNFVGRTESLDEDWRRICERLGIAHQPLPRLNANPIRRHRDYRAYYTPEAIALVREHYAEDIEHFRYDF